MSDQTNLVTKEEFETVKRLLVSAARSAESANRGLDRLEVAQQRTQLQIEQLAEAQTKTEQQLKAFIFESQRLMTQQAGTLAQLKGVSGHIQG